MQLHVTYPASPARLWQALTTRDELAAWFMANDFAAEVGHRFTLWPSDLPGFDGPVSATVLAVEPARLVRMGWRSGQSYAIMTWQLEATRTGCRLKLTQGGLLGSAAKADALAKTYRNLFEHRLQAHVGVHPALASPALPTPAGEPGLTAAPGGPDAAFHSVPRRVPLPAVALGAAVLLLAATLWLVAPGRSSLDGDGTPGAGTLGSAQASAANSAQPVANGSNHPGVTAAPGVPGATAVPGATRLPAPAAASLLSANVTIKKEAPSLFTLRVTVSNAGEASGTWHTIALRLAGLNLVIKDVLGLDHVVRERVHILSPTTEALATVLAHSSVTFTVGVVGRLAGVQECALDAQPCTAF